jgi:hypothetical protein
MLGMRKLRKNRRFCHTIGVYGVGGCMTGVGLNHIGNMGSARSRNLGHLKSKCRLFELFSRNPIDLQSLYSQFCLNALALQNRLLQPR